MQTKRKLLGGSFLANYLRHMVTYCIMGLLASTFLDYKTFYGERDPGHLYATD